MVTRALSRPDDLLSLRQAAALVGRSVDTLRDWRTRYGLADWRDVTAKTAQSLVSRADVLAIAARVASIRPNADGSIDVLSEEPSAPVAVGAKTSAYLQGPKAAPMGSAFVESLLADIKAERDLLRSERDAALSAREAARVEVDRLALRLAELESLIAHGRQSSLADERRRILLRYGVGDPVSSTPKPKAKAKRNGSKPKKAKAKQKRS